MKWNYIWISKKFYNKTRKYLFLWLDVSEVIRQYLIRLGIHHLQGQAILYNFNSMKQNQCSTTNIEIQNNFFHQKNSQTVKAVKKLFVQSFVCHMQSSKWGVHNKNNMFECSKQYEWYKSRKSIFVLHVSKIIQQLGNISHIEQLNIFSQ